MHKLIPTSNSYTLIITIIVILLSSLRIVYCEYPVSPSIDESIPASSGGTGFVINETMYVYGGQLRDRTISNQIAKLSFDEYGAVHYESVNSNGPKVLYAQSVTFSNNDSVAIIGGRYEEYNSNMADSIRAQVYSFSQNTWTTLFGLDGTTSSPPNREGHTAVKAANGLIYIHGGIIPNGDGTIIWDSWSYDPIAGTFKNLTAPPIALYSSTATTLPDGRIVYVGGRYINNKTDSKFGNYFFFNQSVVYNPNGDSWELQGLNADALPSLDKEQIDTKTILVDVLGGDYGINGKHYTTLWVLDTHTWVWSASPTAGIMPKGRIGFSIGRINNEYAVVCFGSAEKSYFNDIDVLKLAGTTDSNNSNKEGPMASTVPEWVQNITAGNTYNKAAYSISKSTIAIISGVCGGLACFICIYIIFRYRHRIQKAMYIHHYLTIQARSGEPLWAEAVRIVSKFLLFLLFTAFFVFLIIQVLESPKAIYTFSKNISRDISLPDVRFCLRGDKIQEDTTNESTDLPISCTTSDGIPCNDYLTWLDLSYHQPKFDVYAYNTQCYLFRGYSFKDYLTPLRLSTVSMPQVNNGTFLEFSFDVSDTNGDGRIYISFYHPERDPNPNRYFGQNLPSFSDQEIDEWVLEDTSRVPADYLDPSEVAYVDYQFEVTESLTDSKWNYFGFASQYNSTPQITTTFQKYSKDKASIDPVSSILLSPASFTLVTHKEQRIYSLVNALGFVGGLYGLITAIQAAVFGYRPQSPFGIIHHWSFGHMKRSIDRGFKDRFGKYKSPVPLVNPVHSRHEPLLYNNMKKQETHEEQNEDQEDDFPNLIGSFDCDNNNNNNTKLEPCNEKKQFTVLNVEENSTQCNSNCQHCIETIQEQARQIELIQERTQLLEHLFRSYYVDDEVFKKVDTAIKEPERSLNQQHSSNRFFRRRHFKKLP